VPTATSDSSEEDTAILEIRPGRIQKRTRWRLIGRLTDRTSVTLRRFVADASHVDDLVVDLSELTVLDAGGAAALFAALRRLAAQGAAVMLINPAEPVLGVLHTLAIPTTFGASPTDRSDALAGIAA
jgi:anti-anti-sigma regulatory factor